MTDDVRQLMHLIRTHHMARRGAIARTAFGGRAVPLRSLVAEQLTKFLTKNMDTLVDATTGQRKIQAATASAIATGTAAKYAAANSMAMMQISSATSKLYNDRYQFRQLRAINNVRAAGAATREEYGNWVADYMTTVINERKAWADQFGQIGEGIGSLIGQEAGWAVAGALSPIAVTGIGAAVVLGAKILVSAVVGSVLSYLGGAIGRFAGPKVMEKYIQTQASTSMSTKVLDLNSNLASMYQDTKYLFGQGINSQEMLSKMRGVMTRSYVTGTSLKSLGADPEETASRLASMNKMMHSDGYTGRMLNFTTVLSGYGVDPTNQIVSLKNVMGNGNKAQEVTERAFLSLAMSVTGDGNITGASLRLASTLNDFVVNYSKNNTASGNIASTLGSIVGNMRMNTKSKEGTEQAVNSATDVFSSIDDISKSMLDSFQAKQTAIKGGLNPGDSSRGAGDSGVFKGLVTGLMRSFDLSKLSMDGNQLNYEGDLGRNQYSYIYRILTAPKVQGGYGLGPDAANNLIKYLISVSKNGFANVSSDAGYNSINKTSDAYRASSLVKLAEARTETSLKYLSIASHFQTEYIKASGKVLEFFNAHGAALYEIMSQTIIKMAKEYENFLSGQEGGMTPEQAAIIAPYLQSGGPSVITGSHGYFDQSFISKRVDRNNAMVKTLLKNGKLTEQDIANVEALAAKYKSDPNWFLAVFMKESSFRRDAVSGDGNHFGYAQVTSEFLSKHGITVEQFKKLNLSGQLPYIEAYLIGADSNKVLADGINSLSELYMLIAAPAYAMYTKTGVNTEIVQYKEGTRAYALNPAWDENDDGKVTVGEVANSVLMDPSSAALVKGMALSGTYGPDPSKTSPNDGYVVGGYKISALAPGTSANSLGRVMTYSRGNGAQYKLPGDNTNLLSVKSVTSAIGLNAYKAMEAAYKANFMKSKGGNIADFYGMCAAVVRRAYLDAGLSFVNIWGGTRGSATAQLNSFAAKGYTMTYDEVMKLGGPEIGDLVYNVNDNHVAMVGPGGALIQAGYAVDTQRGSSLVLMDMSVFGNNWRQNVRFVRPSMDANGDGWVTNQEKIAVATAAVVAFNAQKKTVRTGKGNKYSLSVKDSASGNMQVFLAEGGKYVNKSKMQFVEKQLEKGLKLKDNQVVLNTRTVNGQEQIFIEIVVDGDNLNGVTNGVQRVLRDLR